MRLAAVVPAQVDKSRLLTILFALDAFGKEASFGAVALG